MAKKDKPAGPAKQGRLKQIADAAGPDASRHPARSLRRY